jgi:PEGA domain
MMAEGGPAGSTGTSFSEISELPPLKEVYIAPPPPPADEPEPEPVAPPKPTVFKGTTKPATTKRDEKPKVQTREVAQKAIKEIKSVPPKLLGYAIGGAAALILVIGVGVTIYVHQQNSDDESGARAAAPVITETQTQQPAATEPATPAPQPQEAAPAPTEEQSAEPEVTEEPSSRGSRGRAKHKAAPVAPAIVPGQLALDSTPPGAQVQIDGRADASYVTPFALTNLAPGAHTITISKPGYNADTRQVNIISGSRASVLVHLAQLMATLVVNSSPNGANVYIDGRDSGVKTPGQVSVNKGQHIVLVRKMGYIDETMSTQFVLGQTFNFAPTLRPLGNVDDIHTVGKMSRLFGGKAQAGQSVVSIRTQPKGAQVAINQHIMEKNTPLEVALDPGNYEIDITMTGYAPVRKVITTDRGGKVVVDEVLQPQ